MYAAQSETMFLLCAAFAFIAVRVKRLKQQTLPLMGAMRPASGIKTKAHRQH